MPTIKDIAKAAGVSHATVSNVLNHKGNVSAEKIKLVQDTARAMGYRINEAASLLRSGKARLLAVILPDIQSKAHADLYKALCDVAAERGYSIMLRVTENIPERERSAIRDVLSARAACSVAVTSFLDPASRYLTLAQAGIRVAFVLRSAPEDADFIGFDLRKAAEALACLAISGGAARIGLMTNMLGYPAEKAFFDAFCLAAKGVRVQAVQGIQSQYYKQAFDFLVEDPPDAVVTTCEEMAEAVLRASHAIGMKPPKVYTLAAKRMLTPAQYTVYQLDYRMLGKRVGERLLGGEEPGRILLEQDGVPGPSSFGHKKTVLHMLSIDNPYTGALKRLLPLLEKETGIALSITTLPTAEVSQAFSTPGALVGYDLMRMDIALMDCYATSLFMPLQSTYGVLRALVPEYAAVEGEIRALPFDPSCHLLFYRRDLFDNPRYQRTYLEAYEKPLALPESYEAYAHTAAFFDAYQAETGARGALISRQTSESIAQLNALSQDETWPAPTAAMLRESVAVRRRLEAASLIAHDGNWNSTVDRFARGEAVMMIAHANYAERLSHDPLLRTAGRVGHAASIGPHPLLGGGVIGVARHTDRREAAEVFLAWLYSGKTAQLMALLGGCSPCGGAYANDEVLDIYPWMRSVRRGLETGVRRGMFPRAKKPFHQLQLEERIAFLFMSAVSGALAPEQAVEGIEGAYREVRGS